ncbi:MAG: rubrerythrin family protein [Desulfatirhabdiaceae bacterium]|nr:rubrerythrin family protein [Desulfatirhabdiaceae bacterium]
MNKTEQNLRHALNGEAHASIRYLAFAKQADKEGYSGVARLFKAAAVSEKVHAKSHQCVLKAEEQIIVDLNSVEKLALAIAQLETEGSIKSTAENLQAALDGETDEFKIMYPAMIRDAVEENALDARHSLEYAMSIEMVHAKLFKKALRDPAEVLTSAYHVCPLCGHTVENEAPKKCPYCGVDAKKFIAVD